MKKRTLIFIDGQNLFHSLKSLGLHEFAINWDVFLPSLIEDNTNEELIRAYIFRPAEIFPATYTFDKYRWDYLKDMYDGDYTALQGLNNGNTTVTEETEEKIAQSYHDRKQWLEATSTQFQNNTNKYKNLAQEFNDIEICRSGVLKIYPFTKTIIGEKGVDVALAVKMTEFALSGKCDHVILFAGDADYSEAVRTIKNMMRKVSVVRLKNAYGSSFAMAEQLLELADRIIDVSEVDLKGKFKK